MEIYQLKYFSDVYETHSYSESAKNLFITRQALYRAIKSISAELNAPLFTSDRGYLVPTDEAKRLYAYSRSTLASYNEMIEKLSGGSEEPLFYGVTPDSFETMSFEEMDKVGALMTRIINPLFGKDENTPYNINAILPLCSVTNTPDNLINMVAAGTLPFAELVVYGREPLSNPNLTFSTLRKGQIYIAVNKSDPLTSCDAVTLADLRDAKFTLGTQGEATRRYFDYKTPGFDYTPLVIDLSCPKDTQRFSCEHYSSVFFSLQPHDRRSSEISFIPLDEEDAFWRFVMVAGANNQEEWVTKIASSLKEFFGSR
jgi:hypothetical protein